MSPGAPGSGCHTAPRKGPPSLRVAALFTHPIQYFCPLLKEMSAREDIDLTVYFCSDLGVADRLDPGFGKVFRWDVPLLDGYRYRFLSRPAVEMIRELWRCRYDALWINGYADVVSWIALLAANLVGTRVLLRGDSNLLNERPWHRRMARSVMMRLLLPRIGAALYVGTSNRAFYESYGLTPRRLIFTPHAVNNEFFREQARELRGRRAEIRRSFGVRDDRPVILFCGKLIDKKQPLHLLRAYAAVRREAPCVLLYVGEGRLRSEIVEAARHQGLEDVIVTGFLNQSKISRAYVAGDVLVLPSAWDETWGLVINEAMNFGLPIVTTDKVGAAADLVEHGRNGYVVPAHDVDALARALVDLVRDPTKRAEFGRRSLDIIAVWNYAAVIEGVVTACRADRVLQRA